MAAVERRSSSQARAPTTKFPDFSQEQIDEYIESATPRSTHSSSPAPLPSGPSKLHSFQRWQPRRDGSIGWANGNARGHVKQKSLTEAIHNVRTRRQSVSQNAHEIADALKAPVSVRLVSLCGAWFAMSILSNTSSKSILIAFPKPVTLTLVQFGFVTTWCLISAWLAHQFPRIKLMAPVLKHRIRPPTKHLILTTLPLTVFQIGGHILNSDAMSRIPVSLVHTIKGLSPLFTVLAYRFVFHIRYASTTWLSLIPLTVGVVMACSANFSANFIGLVDAFGSALLFVTQNIVSKKLFNDAAKAEADGTQPVQLRKPDKLNLLCYSSGLAFAFTAPIWLWSEGFSLAADFVDDASVELSNRPGRLDHGRLALEFIFNGTFHFLQSLVAFVLLGLVSPVTYSVASLIKRVAVILFAIVWFGNSFSNFQAVGIGLTFVGLYLYDRTSDAAKQEWRAREKLERGEPLLPINTAVIRGKEDDPPPSAAIVETPASTTFGPASGYANGYVPEERKSEAQVPSRARSASQAQGSGYGWLPPGTKQEETWSAHDAARANGAVPVA
ncbi:MAG: suppressor of loss of ypt1 [Bathelium mastoideum]|nr:MAG: suppressor of loss of ypt1 [Bathelium mastoideum]